MRTRAALVVSLALAVGVLGFTAEEETGDPPVDPVADLCGGTVPAVAEDGQLVARTLYFHGEQPSGTPGQASNFPLGYDSEKTMDDTAPEGDEAKYDLLYGFGLNEAFVGGPTLPYWRAQLFPMEEIVCARAVFFGEASGDLDVRIFADEAYATGNTDAVAPAIPGEEGATFRGWVADFGLIELPETYELLVQVSHHDGLTPTDAAGLVAYDATSVPSRLEYVTVVPLAVAEVGEQASGG